MAELAVDNREDALDLVQEAMFKLAEKYRHKSVAETADPIQLHKDPKASSDPMLKLESDRFIPALQVALTALESNGQASTASR